MPDELRELVEPLLPAFASRPLGGADRRRAGPGDQRLTRVIGAAIVETVFEQELRGCPYVFRQAVVR
jgi:hypothetical protein